MANTAYCVKCKAKVTPIDTKVVTTKNGRRREAGKCKKCGTGTSRMLGKV